MTNISRKKPILIGIVAIVCVSLLLVGLWLQPLARDGPDSGMATGQSLKTYTEPVVDPETNTLYGLDNESWFSEPVPGEKLNLATDDLGSTEFESTNSNQKNYNEAPNVYDGESEFSATEDDRKSIGAGGMPRDIEEADIIKLVDDTLYILNTYRGLIIVDVSDPDEPKIDSRVPLFGYPVEMYIVEPKAYVILTHYYNAFLWAEDSDVAPVYREGSEIVIIDITDHSTPKVEKYIELDGFITDTRRVGEVIYAVANNFDNTYRVLGGTGMEIRTTNTVDLETGRAGTENRTETEEAEPVPEPEPEPKAKEDEKASEDSEQKVASDSEEFFFEEREGTVVVSINMENLDDIKEMDREWFPGSSNLIHVSENAIFVAQPEYEYYDDEPFEFQYEYRTKITYVDISDYHGEIKIKDSFKVPGSLEDRYQMDYYNNMFRIVTHFEPESREELGESKLWIYDTSNPNDITKLGELLIDDAGTLMATRFAGERGYTIHLPRRIDPLDVLDLSDPTNPKLTDILEMPGWITHMEVRGYKILALGVDDSEGQRKVAVSLFDVTDPTNAIMKERVIIGDGYSWSTANWDPKALSVIDDQNLILVPFESSGYNEKGKYEHFSGLQIVKFDLDGNDLVLGGAIEHMGTVQRTRANTERIFAISYQLLQVINAKDIHNPIVTATLELCNNVVDVIPMGDYCIQVISDYNYKTGHSVVKLRTFLGSEPDSPIYLAEKTVEYNIIKVYTNGNYLYLVCTEYLQEEYKTQGRILIFDYSDPTAPIQSSNFLMEYYQDYYYYGYYGYYDSWYYNPRASEIDYSFAQVDGDLMVYHPSLESYYYYGPEIDYGGEKPMAGVRATEEENITEKREEEPREKPEEKEDEITEILYIIDLSNPNESKDVRNITLENTSRVTGLYSNGKTLYLTQYEDLSGYDEYNRWEYKVKNYITKIDLSIPTIPIIIGPINVPGAFLGANDAGTVVYTRESSYDKNYNWHQKLNILELDEINKKATLANAIDLGDSYADVMIQDTTILISYNIYSYDDNYYEIVGFGGMIGTPSNFEPTIKTKIQIINAADTKNLKLENTIGLLNYGSVYKLKNNKLIIQLSDANGLVVYDLSDLETPEFLGYYPTQGWVNSIRGNANASRFYLACGYYGVLMINLL